MLQPVAPRPPVVGSHAICIGSLKDRTQPVSDPYRIVPGGQLQRIAARDADRTMPSPSVHLGLLQGPAFTSAPPLDDALADHDEPLQLLPPLRHGIRVAPVLMAPPQSHLPRCARPLRPPQSIK